MNIYEIVTERVIEQMSKGIIPWDRPWRRTSDVAISYATRKPYSLLNQMLLGEPGEYLTFKQVKELGGSVKKGSLAKFVVFFSFVEKDIVTEDGTKDKEVYPLLRYYHVFNVKDCEGVEPKLKAEEISSVNDPIEMCENIVSEYAQRTSLNLTIKESNSAYYSPAQDEVVMPLLNQFKSSEAFYATFFHELTHSTGAPNRLNRIGITGAHSFGGREYSREELIAEMGSAMLCNLTGIDTKKVFENAVAYLDNWMQALRADTSMIVWAAGRAEKAVKLILNEEVPQQA